MKPFDEQDLIAYHLQELPARRARALERALKTDAALATEFDAYAATLRGFKEEPPLSVNEEMLTRSWTALLPSLPVHRAQKAAPSRWRMPILVGAGLALVAASVFVVRRHDTAPTSPETASMRAPRSEAPLTGSEQDTLSAMTPRVEKSDAEKGTSQQKGNASLSFVPTSIGNDGSAQPRRLRWLPPVVDHAPVLRFIPLATAPPAPVAIPPSQPVTQEPADPVQTEAAGRPLKLKRVSFQHEHPPELTLAMGGTLIGTRELNPGQGAGTYTQSATHAVSAIAAFHQQFHPALGYRVTVSYTRPEFDYNYVNGNLSAGQLGLDGRMYELAATYVVQGPHSRGWSTSVEAGGGVMGILAPARNPAVASNIRVAGVAGVTAEYALTRRIGLHAAYRFQAFKIPDFGLHGPPVSSAVVFSQEPSVGITYRFSHK